MRPGEQAKTVFADRAVPAGFSLVRDRQGNMYSWGGDFNRGHSESHIVMRTVAGVTTILTGHGWGYRDGAPAVAQFASISALALGDDGSLYISDADRVRKITPNGTVTTVARGLVHSSGEVTAAGIMNKLMGIAVDEFGAVYVANYGDHLVQRIAGGKVQTLLEGDDRCSPTGITVVNREVYVLETGGVGPSGGLHFRVRKISANGVITVITR
jgi:hypothetical protein